MRTPLDSYECHHGFGYTKIISSKNGVSSEVIDFVPNGENAEVIALTLKNDSKKQKKLTLTSFVEWCLWNAQDDTTNFQRNFSTGEVEVLGSTIYHRTEYRERRDHFAFFSVNTPINGFDTDRETFLGLNNGVDQPKVVLAGKPQNSVADGWSPIASHSIKVELAPGEAKSFVFILGYIENEEAEKWAVKLEKGLLRTNPNLKAINKKKAIELQKRFSSMAKVNKAMKELREFWDNQLANFSIKTGDEKLDRMAMWNQYQCVVTYNFARSASYFESGIGRGIGFRDTSQDMLGVVHIRCCRNTI